MLGKKVKDIVSGYSGIATAKCEYLNGCIQFKVVPTMGKDGEVKETWFDVGQLKVIGNGISIEKKNTGGPVGKMPKAEHP